MPVDSWQHILKLHFLCLPLTVLKGCKAYIWVLAHVNISPSSLQEKGGVGGLALETFDI